MSKRFYYLPFEVKKAARGQALSLPMLVPALVERPWPSGRCAVTTLSLTMLARPLAAPASEVWRPTPDDVDRISWGRPAKKKGTGSRGVPHRLNSEERVLYDLARRKGFLEIAGSGWRKQRSDAPLANTYRSWCDAVGVPCLVLHKGNPLDELVLDLSPLRTPAGFTEAAAFVLTLPGAADGALVEGEAVEGAARLESTEEPQEREEGEEGDASGEEQPQGSADILAARADAFATEPIHRLPWYALSWARERPNAKTLAKLLAAELTLPAIGPRASYRSSSGAKGRPKAKGAPAIKPGKSRRHGGYGIG